MYNLGYGTSFILTEGFDSVPFWSFGEKLWSGLMLFFILVSLRFAACVLGFRLDPDGCLCLYAKWQFRGPSLLRVPWWNPLQHSTRMLTKCKSDLILISVGHCQGCPLSFLSGLVRSLSIQQGFGIEPLPPEVFWACNTGKRLWGRPRTGWRDYVFELAWEHLNVPLDGQEEVARVREIWAYLLRLLSPWRPDKCRAFIKP